MITALVVDDEEPARHRIRSLLGTDPEVTIVGECRDGGEARTALLELKPDLAFLDIEMPQLNGLEVLRGLPEPPYTIFITAHQQHALDAFALHADDYLLKPFRQDRFLDALSYAKRQITAARALQREPQEPDPDPSVLAQGLLPIKADGRLYLLRMQEIESIVAEGDYVRVTTAKGSHLVRDTMQAMHARLDPARFLRIHRSTIVNLQSIRMIEPFASGECFVTLRSGAEFTMSRSHRAVLAPMLGLG